VSRWPSRSRVDGRVESGHDAEVTLHPLFIQGGSAAHGRWSTRNDIGAGGTQDSGDIASARNA